MTPVVHIVLFKWKTLFGDPEVKDLCNKLIVLKDKCLHAETKEPYILSLTGGKDISIECAQGAFTHGFVIKFSSTTDRDYYVQKDPAHLEFVQLVPMKFDDVRVMDYEVGQF